MDLSMLIMGGLREWVCPVAELLAIATAAIIGIAMWGDQG